MLALIRRIDDLGRIGIPKNIRMLNGFGEKSKFELFIDEEQNRICLKLLPESCALCGSSKNTRPVPGLPYRWICKKCLKRIDIVIKNQ